MPDINPEEKRSYVRGNLSFKVRFRTLSEEEFNSLQKFDNQESVPGYQLNKTINDSNNKEVGNSINAFLIDFLIQINEKLDKLVSKLYEDESGKQLLNHGVGENISGSGMNLISDRIVEPGTIIHTNFILSRFPPVFLDVYGRVIRTSPLDLYGKRVYELGIQFLDLNTNDRENIISCVFQKQRELIRKSKIQPENE